MCEKLGSTSRSACRTIYIARSNTLVKVGTLHVPPSLFAKRGAWISQWVVDAQCVTYVRMRQHRTNDEHFILNVLRFVREKQSFRTDTPRPVWLTTTRLMKRFADDRCYTCFVPLSDLIAVKLMLRLLHRWAKVSVVRILDGSGSFQCEKQKFLVQTKSQKRHQYLSGSGHPVCASDVAKLYWRSQLDSKLCEGSRK